MEADTNAGGTLTTVGVMIIKPLEYNFHSSTHLLHLQSDQFSLLDRDL